MEVNGWHVTANDIKTWTATDKRRAEEILPLLVKKLILASCEPLEIDFPDGDSVAVGGWDGMLNVAKGNNFIPTGKSGWEFGTNEAVKGKADGDYTKRCKNPSPLDPKESTFVFATSRLWTKKDNWVRAKQSAGKWKNVAGINAESLTNWLQDCPAVHRWFSHIIGKLSGHLWDIEQAWGNLSNFTAVSLTCDYFTQGRNNELTNIQHRLKGSPEKHTVKAASYYDALGFTLAAIKSLESLSARFLIVKDQLSWDTIISSESSLILLPDGFQPTGIGDAIQRGHHVLQAVDNYSPTNETIKLNRRQRLVQQEAIEKLGFTSDQASKIYSDTKGYMEPMLRHELLEPKDEILPEWAAEVDPDILFPIFYAGSWKASNAHDKEILSKLSGMEYSSFEKEVALLSQRGDAPVRMVGGYWQVISKVDFWFLIKERLTEVVFTKLEDCCESVLADVDPSFELASDERYLAQTKGMIPLYSPQLKEGIADSLAIITIFSDTIAEKLSGSTPSIRIKQLLQTIFQKNTDVSFWYSLGECTQLLAEAAPDEFLQAVNNCTKGDNSPIYQLFRLEGDNALGSSWCHTNLLWGLECISWSKEHFTQAVMCLARLSEIDPGGRVSNRPFQSLVDIFLGWINNSSLSHQDRFQILEKVLARKYPKVAWQLQVKLLHDNTSMTSGVAQPKYQEWVERDDKSVDRAEYAEYINSIVELMIKEAGADLDSRICDLASNFSSYSEEQSSLIIDLLCKLEVDQISTATKEHLNRQLRKDISHHRKFPEADWRWPNEVIEGLEKAYGKLSQDNEQQESYLFDDHRPDIIPPAEKLNSDHDEFDIRQSLRVQTIENIFKKSGIEGIESLANSCKLPGLVGEASYNSTASEAFLDLSIEGLKQEGSLNKFGSAYIRGLTFKDTAKAEEIFHQLPEVDDSLLKAKFLVNSPVNGTSLEHLKGLNQAAQEYYWRHQDRFYLSDDSTTLIMQVARELLNNNRPDKAIEVFHQALRQKPKAAEAEHIDARLGADILLTVVMTQEKIFSTMDVYYIEEVIKYCQECGQLTDSEIQQIEWPYVVAFSHGNFEPVYLQKAVISDPKSFSQLICYLYKRSEGQDEPENISDEIKENRATAAWHLLRMLKVLPGTIGDVLESRKLTEWVDKARASLRENGRVDIGDDRIGDYLSRCPVGEDGLWPHEAVRDVIETIQSENFERGFIIGRRNLRGTTVRHPYAGGAQERELAAKYEQDAQKIQLIHPRTAKVLRELAKSYSQDANQQDNYVEIGY